MRGVLTIASAIAVSASLAAQSEITLGDAVQRALKNYPAVDVSHEQVNAAAAAIRLARTAYLPRLDAVAQVNRATRNNVMGLLLPQSILPSISGPVLGTNSADTAWGSAVGLLVSWEPFDFGLRSATVGTAAAARARSDAALRRSQFEVAASTADAYLSVAAAQQTAVAAQAGVDRAQVLVRTVDALVNAQLRPGAEGSRARAEAAAAETQLIQAQQAIAVAKATLAQFTGGEPAALALPPRPAAPPAPGEAAPFTPATNPIAAEQQAAVEQTIAELRALERTYFPRVLLQGAAYARGTGAEPTGALPGGTAGLAPDVQNYAIGVTITFPVLDAASLRARQAVQAATVRSEQARARQLAADLRARWNAAVAALDGARRIATNTPTEVAAAQAATEQARARYQSGLGPLVDLADAQRLLTSAEIDDALARLNVWRALLGVAVAAGDIQPFISTFAAQGAGPG